MLCGPVTCLYSGVIWLGLQISPRIRRGRFGWPVGDEPAEMRVGSLPLACMLLEVGSGAPAA